ncbi:MAG: ABC transporter ATP-binding protein [Planctomycetota bacterium]|nr:ABC transporter ATP-binding protein [Planctomycetota bacterium]GIK51031.1 MAG: ABC transporter ATP-binding protein [Planctomycetota bacterium]
MKTLRFVLDAYRKNSRWTLVGVVSSLLGTACQVVIPVFFKLVIDELSPEAEVHRGIAAWGEGVVRALVGEQADVAVYIQASLGVAVAFAAALAVATFYKRYYLIRLSRKVEYELKKEMYEHLQNLPGRYYDAKRSGGLMSLMTSDVEAVRMMIGPAIMYLSSTLLLTPAALAIMLTLNATLTGFALLPLVGLALATLYFSPRVRKYATLAQEDLEQISARAQENFAGARVVKAFAREEFEVRELDRLGEKYYRNKLAQARNSAFYGASIFVFGGLGILVILYFGAREIAASRFSIGDFLAFTLYNVQLYWPMIAIGWVTMLFVRGAASLQRIRALLNEAPDSAQWPGGERVLLKGEIEFREVSLVYKEGTCPALDSVSFKLAPGRTLAIVGPVGSGKSSIANLLLRLIAPTSGAIFIDGIEIEKIDPVCLREQCGYVPQDSFLFSESVQDNIALGLRDDDAREQKVREAAKNAAFAEEVESLPSGYDTLLGERGVNLSGGQKQRAAIARALAKQPRIVVLDDCLSAVDTRTEDRILRALKQQTAGVTTLIIAQRISTVAHADEILVLDGGRVVERGTDESLRAKGGLYADLARRQELAEELA